MRRQRHRYAIKRVLVNSKPYEESDRKKEKRRAKRSKEVPIGSDLDIYIGAAERGGKTFAIGGDGLLVSRDRPGQCARKAVCRRG